MLPITSPFRKLSDIMTKMSGEELIPEEVPEAAAPEAPAPEEPAPEEKDQDALLQEHVKNNQDKYRLAFEALFPKAQMVAKNVEYHGAVVKDKIRLMVDFETPMLNFYSLDVMANKEIGIEATGEKTFRVYNIFLPKVKDPTIEKKES